MFIFPFTALLKWVPLKLNKRKNFIEHVLERDAAELKQAKQTEKKLIFEAVISYGNRFYSCRKSSNSRYSLKMI